MSKGENNLTAKIFALIIAIVLWSYVMSVENPYITKNIKNISVNLYNTSSLDRRGLVIMDPQAVKISVEVGGKKTEVDRFTSVSPSNIVAEIDLSGYDEGQVRIPVRVSLLNNPSGVEIVNWEPKEILFTLDKVIPKEKSVGIQVEGELGDDYILGEITPKPGTVLIRGPRTWVNEVSEVKAIVDVTGKTSTSSMTVPIQISDDQGNEVRGLEKEPTVVEVNIPILRKHTLPVELQTEGELPEGYSITDIKINPGTVAIKGDSNILNLSYINTEAININDLMGKTSVEVDLDLPPGVELLNPNEKISINYVIEEIEDRSYTYSFTDIDPRNLQEGLTIESENPEDPIEVILQGAKNDLDKITSDDLKLYLDLQDLDEGIHTINIQIESISGTNVDSIMPETIRVKLNKK